jgi:hypothetical protein
MRGSKTVIAAGALAVGLASCLVVRGHLRCRSTLDPYALERFGEMLPDEDDAGKLISR